jgi:ABC-2 type transport system permease protein
VTPKKIHAIIRKETYHLMRDFRSLYLAFFIPLLLILLFGYALSLDVENIPMLVVDHDNTEMSRDIIRRLSVSSYFNLMGRVSDTRELVRRLDKNATSVGVVIPSGFTENMRSGRKSPLQVIIDGSDPNYAGLTRSYINTFLSEYNRKQLAIFLNRQGKEGIKVPVEGRIRVWFNEDLESKNFIVPGITAIIIMIVGAMLTSLVIAREYENGTMETILSLPVTGVEFLIGKAVPYFFIGLIDVLIAVLMGQLLFGVVMKSSFWLMVLASTLYLNVALSIGLLISTLTKSQLVANQMAILVTYLPSLLLSDFVFPIVNMPSILQKITYIVPATYYIDILSGLYLRNLAFLDLWPNYFVLFLMFALLSFSNVKLLQKEGM